MNEFKRKNNKILAVCCGGIVNQAIIVNITALLYVAFMQLYNFSYLQMALVTAVGFLSQLGADILQLIIIDKIDKYKMAKLACVCSGLGLLFYAFIPILLRGNGIYIGILIATIIFAFFGGFLEIILSSIADKVPTTFGGICLLQTVYAWAFALLGVLFLGYYLLFGFAYWNYIIFLLAIVPFIVYSQLHSIQDNMQVQLPQMANLQAEHESDKNEQKAVFKSQSKGKSKIFIFYMFAFLAVFFGYGCEMIVSQWVSIFASTIFQNDTFSMVGAIFFAICLGIGGLVYIYFLQKKQRIPLVFYLIACIATTLLFVLAGLLQQTWLALLFLMLSGLFVGILSPSAITYASKNNLYLGSWLFALLAISQDLSASILPSIFGVVAENSIRQALLIAAPLPILAAIMLFSLHFYKKSSYMQ